jgi:hypothetical protein
MPDAARFRDSTQILLPKQALNGLRDELEDRFTLTIQDEKRQIRLIGSPSEIKDVSRFLTRNGITID